MLHLQIAMHTVNYYFLMKKCKASPRLRRYVPVMVATTKTAPGPSQRGANVWLMFTSQAATSSSTSVCSSCTCVTVHRRYNSKIALRHYIQPGTQNISGRHFLDSAFTSSSSIYEGVKVVFIFDGSPFYDLF
jgi:hypothetical protein